MSEKEDQIIQLLKEIRDNQVESYKCAKKQQEDYSASLLKHEERVKADEKYQALHKKRMYLAGVAFNLFLGIIAICSVLRLVLLFGR